MLAKCPYCGTNSGLHLQSRDYNRRLSTEQFPYYYCGSCKLLFLLPIPQNLGDYYPPDYYSIPKSLIEWVPATEAQRYKIEIVKEYKQYGELLEIGPACGDFAYLAKQAGFDVDTIEMDERCCRFLREEIGVTAINSDDVVLALSSPECEKKIYDVIVLWHVIEHLANPWSTLNAAVRHLSPGGILVIAAPNPSALQFRVLRKFWPHLDAPRHVLLIPIQIIEQRLRQLGLKPILVTTSDPGALGWNVFGWQQFFSNFFAHPRLKSMARKIGGVVASLFAPLERSGLRGSTYTLVFQKTEQ